MHLLLFLRLSHAKEESGLHHLLQLLQFAEVLHCARGHLRV